MSEQPGDPVRVMIVEDDPAMLERFAAALVRDPRTKVVGKARTGKEAIARLLLATPEVLLVDLGLPDIHGTEVIRFAARNLPECDIMVITVFGDERNVISSIESGATGYVLKDCSDADLITRIVELRAGGSPMSPGIARIVLNQMRAGTAAAPAPGRRSTSEDASSALTARETDVLRLLSRGYSYSEVGDRLGISIHTVTSHIKNCYRKLAVHSGTAAVTRAAELGLLRPGGDKGGGN